MLYPILSDSRIAIDLSGVWKFKRDNGEGFEHKWFQKTLKNPDTMPVPASYNDLKEGVDFREHYGWVFYQRTISLPAYLKEQRIMLRFDAVTHYAKVYLNGELVTEHKGGFLPFEVDITDSVRADNNLLTVAVSNVIDYTTLPVGGKKAMLNTMIDMGEEVSEEKRNYPNFDFFNYCGITRPVRIYTTPKKYIEDISCVSKVIGTDAEIEYKVETCGGTGVCKVEVFDEKGEKVAENEGAEGVLKIENATLWQPLNAYLYNVVVEFEGDVYTLPYGIRTIQIDGSKFLINGKPFYFKGYGKHEDTFPNGRGMNIPMNTKDISLMKWQGANSFRTSHYPYSEEMMRLCDREGIVVIDETTAVGINLKFGGGANFNGTPIGTFDKEHGVQTFEHHKEVIRDLIKRDKNHPCVVVWSIANEPDSGSEGAYEYFEPLYALAKELDPEKRPCTLVSVQMVSPQSDVSRQLSDIICLNRYYGWYSDAPDLTVSERKLRAELAEWKKCGKPIMFTEYGADTIMGMHDTTPVMYTEEYQVDYYKMYHKVFDDLDFVVGEQVWNFADFATSQSLLRIQGNKKGIFTRDRKPKLAAHYLRERWTQIPEFNYKK